MNIKSILKWTTTFHSGSSQFGSKRVLLVKKEISGKHQGKLQGAMHFVNECLELKGRKIHKIQFKKYWFSTWFTIEC